MNCNDNIKPVVETIMEKGTWMQGTYEKASVAMVAKHVPKYGVFCTFRYLNL